MKKTLFMIFLCCCMMACGHKNESESSGTASVLSTSGRTSCEWVQLWENGPKWATFNVGATITSYAHLTAGTDPTDGNIPYYNTANVGGLYPWNNPNLNSRKTTRHQNVSTGISDVATTLWGGNWKTPSKEQLDTLCDEDNKYGKTTWIWYDGSTTQYVRGCTLAGWKVTGVGEYAERSIFLPAVCYFSHRPGDDDYYGYYWSSTEDDSYDAFYLSFGSGSRGMYGFVRKFGLSVRAVLAE